MAWTRFGKKKDMPGGLWIKCESCGAMLFRKDFEQKHRVCGTCGYHFTLAARERIELTADADSFEELWRDVKSYDVLGFVDKMPYGDKLKATAKKTGEADAVVTGFATVKGIPCGLGVMNFAFLGGSMGMVVGEKLAMLCEAAVEREVPVVMFACSGGARMHEGAVSLMQMAKTCGALTRLNQAGQVSISVLTHPTTGGVTASFASVCDLTVAEPGALIGFAGPRVIATTIKKELPKGFQRSEFLLEKGQVDRIVARSEMRDELGRLLAYATGRDPVAAFQPDDKPEAKDDGPDDSSESGGGKKRADSKSSGGKAKSSASKSRAAKAGAVKAAATEPELVIEAEAEVGGGDAKPKSRTKRKKKKE